MATDEIGKKYRGLKPSRPREFIRIAESDGWIVSFGSKHLILRHPEGHGVVTVSSTAGDRRAYEIAFGDMRRSLRGYALAHGG